MRRKVVVAGALVSALLSAFSGTASASQVPWQTTARNANVVCLGYDNKIFKLPGLAALQKVKTAKDFTPALLKKSAAPYFAGELALEQDMLRKWSALAIPREPAYRVAWARWLTLWKTVRIPAAQKIAASAKRGDLKAFQAAQAPIDAHAAEGAKLEKTLGFAVCQWQ
jgi:hypothetical protein